MNKLIISALLLLPIISIAQSYAPPAGEQGTTAIHKDDLSFSSWASGITVERGFVNINDTTIEANGSNRATFGEPDFALGASTGNTANAVSLGDSGIAILTFDQPIIDGPGFDFAVFENSFSNDYLEFAHVEVSTDGINYVRFPSHSEVQSDVQIHGFGLTDTKRIHNLAGKYRIGYGTPFDLNELEDSTQIDVNNINFVKIIDVVGSVGDYGTLDSFGNKINEPFPTPYETGGFDLEAVGVINELVNLEENNTENLDFKVYPNPANDFIHVEKDGLSKVELIDAQGKVIISKAAKNQAIINVQNLPNGLYFLKLTNSEHRLFRKIIVKK